jgi:hypothetical protein
MAANVYRLYGGDVIDNNRYLFSIVASEDTAAYVVPAVHLESYGGYNNQRLRQILDNTQELPNTPDEWAALVKENIDRASMFSIDQYDTIEEAIKQERILADDLAEEIKAKGESNE